jgi:hypothetical protein
MDSLEQIYAGDKQKLDSVITTWKKANATEQLKFDSLNNILANSDAIEFGKDSLTNKLNDKVSKANDLKNDVSERGNQLEDEISAVPNKVKMKADQVTDELSKISLGKKSNVFSKIYFEGIVSTQGANTGGELHFSPAIGFMFAKNFSIGGGPNLILKKDH